MLNFIYVIVVGVFSVPLSLVNVYGPNFDKPEFKKKFDQIPDISDTYLIVGGDFNCVLDSYLDKSSSTKIVSSNSNSYVSNSNIVTLLTRQIIISCMKVQYTKLDQTSQFL